MRTKTWFYLSAAASAVFALNAVMDVLAGQWLVAGLWVLIPVEAAHDYEMMSPAVTE
jgi:hypothetical protein